MNNNKTDTRPAYRLWRLLLADTRRRRYEREHDERLDRLADEAEEDRRDRYNDRQRREDRA